MIYGTRELGVAFSAQENGVKVIILDRDMNVTSTIDLTPTAAAMAASNLLKEMNKIGKPVD